MVLPWSWTYWGKHVFPHVAVATDDWADTIFWHRSWKRKLQKWYLRIVMRTTSFRPVIFLQPICTVWCTKLRKHFNAIMEVLYCFTVAIGLPGDASDYKTIGQQLQCACKSRCLSSEATVRVRNKILGIWATLKQLSENKNDAMCVV